MPRVLHAMLAITGAAAALIGCQLPLDHAACPCASGWVCCPTGNVCVSEASQCPGQNGGPPDASGDPDGSDPGDSRGPALAQRIQLDHGWAGDKFGQAVALDGDTAAIGVPGRDAGVFLEAGAVVVFERRGGDAGVWVQTALIAAPEPTSNGEFGSRLQLVAPDTLLITAPGAAGGAGRAYVFGRTADGWSRVQTLEPDTTGLSPNQLAQLRFGSHLARDGMRVAIAASDATAEITRS